MDKNSYELLKLLRKNTILSPIAYFKILKERELAEDYQSIINKLEHCYLGVDYSKAEELELNLRFKSWFNKVLGIWYKYDRQSDPYEFAVGLLLENEDEEEKKLLR